MKGTQRREREASADGYCNETTKIVIGSKPARSAEGRSARCAAALEELDDNHASAAARAWRAMIGRGVGIGGGGCLRQINPGHRGGGQLPGAGGGGFSGGACPEGGVGGSR